MRLIDARLYYICGIDRLDTVEPALRGGVDIFQLRDKHASDDELLRAAAVARAPVRRARRAVRPQRPAGPRGRGRGRRRARRPGRHATSPQAREIVGPDVLVGRSTHSPEQVDGAARRGLHRRRAGARHADEARAARRSGRELVRYAAAHASVPFFAIGGLDAETLPGAVAAGATRAAVVRAISEAPGPGGGGARAATPRWRCRLGRRARQRETAGPAPAWRGGRRGRAGAAGAAGARRPPARPARGRHRRGRARDRERRALRRGCRRARQVGQRRRGDRLRSADVRRGLGHVEPEATGRCSASRRCSPSRS